MKIYIAASLSARAQMLKHMKVLNSMGHVITSDWIYNHDVTAWDDYKGVKRSDLVMVFTEVESTSGGLWVELGLAIGLDLRVMTIGPKRNIFQDICEEYEDWHDAFRSI